MKRPLESDTSEVSQEQPQLKKNDTLFIRVRCNDRVVDDGKLYIYIYIYIYIYYIHYIHYDSRFCSIKH